MNNKYKCLDIKSLSLCYIMSDQNKKVCQESSYITQESIRRLVSDIADVHKNPLTDEGIYYIHDDKNMLNGYAMIIGPKDTPYENGVFFFTFQFPYNYPHVPPVVKYCTNDGKTRFNPNLYRNGKVCLSILNTWRGEGWTSCQTIRSVLLTLLTTLNDKPLLNEPGVKEEHPDFEKYNIFISLKTHEMINHYLLEDNIVACFKPFYHIIKQHFLEKEKRINEQLQKWKNVFKERYNSDAIHICTSIYSLDGKFYIKKIHEQFKQNIKLLK